MKPGKLDLPTIWRGCDWGPVILKWKDQNGDPINLSGWQARAYSRNINLHAQITDYAGGVSQLILGNDLTKGMRIGREKWDWIFERLPPGNYRFPPFLSGYVIIADPATTIPPEMAPSDMDGDNGSLPEFDLVVPEMA